MSRRRLAELLLLRWGFPFLVAIAVAIGLVAAVYRAEVGAALFFALYVATMAFALALQNRGFTEIGTGGVRARDLAADPREEIIAMDTIADLVEETRELRATRALSDDGR